MEEVYITVFVFWYRSDLWFSKFSPSLWLSLVLIATLCFSSKTMLFSAWENADYHSVSGKYMYPPSMLWCFHFPADEREEAHMDLSSVWQASPLWQTYHWWVGHASQLAGQAIRCPTFKDWESSGNCGHSDCLFSASFSLFSLSICLSLSPGCDNVILLVLCVSSGWYINDHNCMCFFIDRKF